MNYQRIPVRSSTGTYDVVFGHGVLRGAGKYISALGDFTGVFLLSSPRVWKHCGGMMAKSFRGVHTPGTILFDDRESAKNLATVERISRQLVRAGADRKAVLVAVGGGVVGDVAGFVAASYLRGVALVHIPTTLVGLVDSAIGGKTGVDLPEGKNLVGAFYPPRLVLADPQALLSLPLRDYRSGIYEVIKYGIIGDRPLFQYLEKNFAKVVKADRETLGWIIPRCIQMKADVVTRDERESGLREKLNFGHTFGHAFEVVTRYRIFRHGEAVAWGMMAAALLGMALGRTSPLDSALMIRLISQVGKLPALPQISPRRILEAMRSDKKSRGGRLRFVISPRIGSVEIIADVPERTVERVLQELPTFLEEER